jgi:hypothetical protein
MNARGRQEAGPSTRTESLPPRGDASPALAALTQRWDELGFNPFASDGDHPWPESTGPDVRGPRPEGKPELPAEERTRGTPLEETRSSVRALPLRGTSSAGFLREVPLRERGRTLPPRPFSGIEGQKAGRATSRALSSPAGATGSRPSKACSCWKSLQRTRSPPTCRRCCEDLARVPPARCMRLDAYLRNSGGF